MEIITHHREKIKGVLSTFDRILFKGHLPSLYQKGTQSYFLHLERVKYKDFTRYAQKCTTEVQNHAKRVASESGRPYIHLNSPHTSKEKKALEIMKQENISEGLICVLGCVESCGSFCARKNPKTHQMELVSEPRKGLHVYFYYMDKELGFMNVRLGTWFPFGIQIYINGREYLSRQLDQAGISYERYDNCFLDISDVTKAQEIADQMEKKKWCRTLDAFARKVNPFLNRMRGVFSKPEASRYYWCFWQCEYATDVMFKSQKELGSVYPDLVEHAVLCFGCEDVMTFLGRKLHGNFKGEMVSDMKRRPKGLRVKHRMKSNFIKMYDKFSVLRIETIINDPKEFKTYKSVIRKGESKKEWIPMGKSVANIYRYAQVAKSSNARYLNALSNVKETGQVRKELESICKKVKVEGKSYTAFNPMAPEVCTLFKAVLEGGNHINGFSNKIIRPQLYPQSESNNIEKRRAVGRVCRLLRKLRAHQLIAKIPRSFRYKVTKKGIRIMAATLKIKTKEMPLIMRE
ncbi:MAG: hypothetical protein GY940_09840 [bacterium]|nr:hypothetical protein [bacterium]